MTVAHELPPPAYAVFETERRDNRTRVLKHGDTFAVFGPSGDILSGHHTQQGLYHCGTRHLSHARLTMQRREPLLLSSSISPASDRLAIDLTNPDITRGEETPWNKGLLHVLRRMFLWRGTCYQRIQLTSYSSLPVTMRLTLELAADFADIFEVRGTHRKARGRTLPTVSHPGGLVFAYEGLDGVVRQTAILCDPAPEAVTEDRLEFDLELAPRGVAELRISTACQRQHSADPAAGPFTEARDSARKAAESMLARCPALHSSNELFDGWLARSRADVYLMVTETPEGPYPYAGIPWFSTAFGRDGIITAISMLWADPSLARGVLAYLAATQATEDDPARDAQPGKILHERRDGEMAALGEVPFGRYYGSVDATPLFVLLAGRYYDRTGDLAFIRRIWPNLERALAWVDRYGDADGDGFIEYARRTEEGLAQQGWKDSHDAVFHADGTLAEPPIALAEVQGYVYGARHHAAELAAALGMRARSRRLVEQAEQLHRQFEERFWRPSLGTFALALDGRKQPCDVVSSNAGQCLISGIALPDHAARVAEGLMSDDMFTGWGLRTLHRKEQRYNPMSYHNGSVWPHDTALIATGLARYGAKDAVVRLATGLFDAAQHFEQQRLPELFCGFPRRPGEGPTRYPVACAPQAWAAAAAFQMLKALLGLEVDGIRRVVRFREPQLPESIDWLRIVGLEVGDARVDLLCERRATDVGVSIVRRTGDVTVATER